MYSVIKNIRESKRFTGTIAGLRGSSVALLAARTALECSRPVVVIVPSEGLSSIMEQDLAMFSELPVFLFPGYDIPPYTPLSPDSSTIAARLSSLYQILNRKGPFLLVIPAEALLRRIIPRDKLSNLAELVIRGEETDQDALITAMIKAGYEKVSLVQNPGEFSVRGSILDIFPPSPGELFSGSRNPEGVPASCPVRLDFFGDTVESIRLFDPISQRSILELEEFTILPVSDILFSDPENDSGKSPAQRFIARGRELGWDPEEIEITADRLATGRRFPGIEFLLPVFHDEPATPLDYLPENTICLLVDPPEIDRSLELVWERIETNYHEAVTAKRPTLPPSDLFLTPELLERELASRSVVCLQDFPDTDPGERPSGAFRTSPPEAAGNLINITSGNHTLLGQELELERRKKGLLTPLTEKINTWLSEGNRVVLSCRSERHANHFAELLGQHNLETTIVQAPVIHPEKAPPGKVAIVPSPLSSGFDLPDELLHVISESELFGEKRITKRQPKTPPESEAVSFDELQTGETVVHRTHGLGSYAGLVNMTANGREGEFLQINFLDDDRLYVPIDRINMVHKYKGLSDQEPKLDKLGGKAWVTAKNKVKEAVWKVARELLDLYARRQLADGRAFSEPDEMFHELEESFPYDETSGQMKAINDVLDDLTSTKVMDRLVCGDVGYGKTEVAVRGAFKVISDGCQVAVLVPTTVLAEQHAVTFRERFARFPIRVETLNRFRPPAEQKRTLQGLKEGTVDIVIGTHRLLSKDVQFRKLGLLIIDEEHRFGVTHKEKIKKMRTGVDVLTLTATPIPRTLQLSLLGIRDLSVISSPPRHRRSVKTFVAKFDDLVIKEAITRELQRSGQVFVIHNRVNSIQEMAHRIQKLRPEATVAVAHGQMPGRTLEEIMVRFVNGEIDVLVCTTIVESGLDIPNANTIIMTRADRLGLADIYQLRGRVGRSREQAYAYLLVPSMDGLSKDAKRRLRALMDYNELGGGFKLAMSDLQIRGGGNILGESQSGNIAAVGYDLYLELLQQTVEDLKRRNGEGDSLDSIDEVDPEINLQLAAYIPESYIRDTDQRYIAYRKITACRGEDALDDIRSELRDRYGAIPDETANLLEIVSLKEGLEKLKVKRLDQGDHNLVLSFTEQTRVEPIKLMQLIEASAGAMRLTPDSRLVVRIDGKSPETVISEAKKLLRTIFQNATTLES
ncbi:MAG: transcription-repair coupling factor [Proteobacteria bacterium]|nr:transcription-repair coupling factor [Pseudomonadota bacterium]